MAAIQAVSFRYLTTREYIEMLCAANSALLASKTNKAIVSGKLKSTLNRMSKSKDIHTIYMSLREISDLAGWMTAKSNHAQSSQKVDEPGWLCDHFESIEFQIKQKLIAPKKWK